MTEILHRVVIKSTPEQVFAAITSQEGLSSWWTTMVETNGEKGSIAKFRFGDGSMGADMKLTEIVEGRKVSWFCTNGPWEGTSYDFEIEPDEKGAALNFSNHGWEKPDNFYRHCNCKWGFFLGTSLKDYIETGKGRPHPDDPDF